jgi:hypothetical protein
MSFWQRMLRAAPYHTAFLGSTNHAWLALVTLGVGVAVATPAALFAGVAAYGLGVIFLPDLAVFRKNVDARRQSELDALQQADLSSKAHVRSVLLKKLTPKAREQWQAFLALCTELQGKLTETGGSGLLPDNSLTKVADSHLLLLGMDAEIRAYLDSAESPAQLDARREKVRAEIAKLQKRPALSAVEQRLLLSREETLKNLEQQSEQAHRMEVNLELAQSELQRLESEVNALRAELVSTPANQLSSRLGEALVQVEASQRVLQEGGMVNAPDLNTLLGEHA